MQFHRIKVSLCFKFYWRMPLTVNLVVINDDFGCSSGWFSLFIFTALYVMMHCHQLSDLVLFDRGNSSSESL